MKRSVAVALLLGACAGRTEDGRPPPQGKQVDAFAKALRLPNLDEAVRIGAAACSATDQFGLDCGDIIVKALEARPDGDLALIYRILDACSGALCLGKQIDFLHPETPEPYQFHFTVAQCLSQVSVDNSTCKRALTYLGKELTGSTARSVLTRACEADLIREACTAGIALSSSDSEIPRQSFTITACALGDRSACLLTGVKDKESLAAAKEKIAKRRLNDWGYCHAHALECVTASNASFTVVDSLCLGYYPPACKHYLNTYVDPDTRIRGLSTMMQACAHTPKSAPGPNAWPKDFTLDCATFTASAKAEIAALVAGCLASVKEWGAHEVVINEGDSYDTTQSTVRYDRDKGALVNQTASEHHEHGGRVRARSGKPDVWAVKLKESECRLGVYSPTNEFPCPPFRGPLETDFCKRH